MDASIPIDHSVVEGTRESDAVAPSVEFESFKERIGLKCREFCQAFLETVANGRNKEFMARCEEFFVCRQRLGECWAARSTGKVESYANIDLISDGDEVFNPVMRQRRFGDGKVVETISELYEASEVAKGVFKDYVMGLVEACEGTELWLAEMKGRERAVEKATDDYSKREAGPGMAWLFDIVRGSVICDDEDAICAVLGYLLRSKTTAAVAETSIPSTMIAATDCTTTSSRNTTANVDDATVLPALSGMTISEPHDTQHVVDAPDVSVLRLKNRFTHSTPGGFRDININLRVKIGEVVGSGEPIYYTCELQVHCRAVLELGKQLHSHHVYEYFRVYFRGSTSAVEMRMRLMRRLFGKYSSPSDIDVFADNGRALSSSYAAELVTAVDGISTVYESAQPLVRHLNLLKPFLQLMAEHRLCHKLEEIKYEVYSHYLEPYHSDTLASVSSFGSLFAKIGDYASARPLLVQALAGYETVLGPDHPETLKSATNLGYLFSSMGDNASARPLYERALAGYEKAYGPDHPDTLQSVSGLGSVLKSMGDYASACPLFERALAGREKVLGSDHRNTLVTVSSLGNLFFSLRDYAAARPLYERALAGNEKALGPDHPDTLISVSSLGSLYSAMRDSVSARPLFERALAGYEKALGPDHPHTLAALNNIGNLFKSIGDYASARTVLERALAGYEKAVGPDHPNTLKSVTNLGILFKELEDYGSARSLFERALAGREKVLGPEHPHTLNAVDNLGSLYSKMENYASARSLYERVLVHNEKVYGPDHRSTLASVNNLCKLHAKMGDFASARPLYERALAGYEKVLGPGHRDTLQAVRNLAMFEAGMGDVVKATELFRRLLVCGLEDCAQNGKSGLHGIDMYMAVRDHVDMYPSSVSLAPEVHPHPLTKIPRRMTNCVCNLCREPVFGALFNCRECGFDAHLQCVPQCSGILLGVHGGEMDEDSGSV